MILALLGLLNWWNRKNAYRSLNSLPSPPRHWLLGNLPQVLLAVRQKKYFQFLFDWSRKLGPIYVYWIGAQPILALSKPRAIEETIINGMKDGSLVRSHQIRDAWNDASGGAVIIGQDGKEWQWRRMAWNPEFSSSGLSKHIDIIDQACTQVIEKIRATPSGETILVDPLFVELTMRVTCCLVLGIPLHPKISSTEGPPLEVEKVYEAMSVISYRFLRIATGEKKWQKYLPTQLARDYWRAIAYLESFLASRLDLALKLRDNTQSEEIPITPMFRESMLVKIIAKEPQYNRSNLVSEIAGFLLAGTDTTAHTLSFATAQLSLNPRVLDKARSLVDQVGENLKELNYIRSIVKETMRLYPVAAGSTSLEATRDTVIEGIKVPRGTRVFWSMWAAGRDPDTYTNPEEFLPERWLEEGKDNHDLPFIQFGSGYHRCLGEPLAMIEATMMLAKLLRYFEWELVNGGASLENLQQNLLVYPSDRMPLRFRLR
ncbi:cytochrome P450 [Gloeocapsa sp. PCC 73106]|uniref:cytochrome P450 n=1 Tax=Gloeocapsa sp. PCC 73106 TaxID=102232 RepID=UPI0002AC0A3E|nr:cytochrome P450 [Gloeocapsa sp. PCC 73106]ELR97209.1 cytochrome P450 [Gloeocapsa sp. PCC 73106]